MTNYKSGSAVGTIQGTLQASDAFRYRAEQGGRGPLTFGTKVQPIYERVPPVDILHHSAACLQSQLVFCTDAFKTVTVTVMAFGNSGLNE